MADVFEVFFMQIEVLLLRLGQCLAVANEMVSDPKLKESWGLSFHN